MPLETERQIRFLGSSNNPKSKAPLVGCWLLPISLIIIQSKGCLVLVLCNCFSFEEIQTL